MATTDLFQEVGKNASAQSASYQAALPTAPAADPGALGVAQSTANDSYQSAVAGMGGTGIPGVTQESPPGEGLYTINPPTDPTQQSPPKPAPYEPPGTTPTTPTTPTATPSAGVPTPNVAGNLAPEETVQGQLSSLFTNKEMNPLWQYAEGLGTQYANSRGLANSSMAAEAGAQAVFAQAMPIASQDATAFFARAQQAAQGDINAKLQLEQFGYNFDLSEQENLHNLQLAALQGDIQAGLALQQFGFDTELMEQDFGFRSELMDQELRNALGLGEAQQDDMLEQIALNNQNTLDQIAANGNAELQTRYLTAVETRTGQFSFEVTQIYQTQGLTPYQQQAAVETARRNYLNDVQFIQDQYSSSPGWDPEWILESPTNPNTYPGTYPGIPTYPGMPPYMPPISPIILQ